MHCGSWTFGTPMKHRNVSKDWVEMGVGREIAALGAARGCSDIPEWSRCNVRAPGWFGRNVELGPRTHSYALPGFTRLRSSAKSKSVGFGGLPKYQDLQCAGPSSLAFIVCSFCRP